MRLYSRERSGNCYKVRLMLALLRIEYENVPVHRTGKGRNELPQGFEQLSPLRQVPVLESDGKAYWGTIAILVYLARKYGGEHWLPLDAEGEAEVTQWLSLAQNEIFTVWGARAPCAAGAGTVTVRSTKRMPLPRLR
jgi:glutathione S-transferase